MRSLKADEHRATVTQINVVQNRQEELKRRGPTK